MSGPSVEHLSPDMRKFVRKIDRDFELEDHPRRLLVLAAEAHDRGQQARERLATDGLTITTRRPQWWRLMVSKALRRRRMTSHQLSPPGGRW